MNTFRRLLLCCLLLPTIVAQAQPGIEGYWGYSEIKVRLSTPTIIHTAPLELSPRYFEADTIPPKSFELMDLGRQLTERTQALGQAMGRQEPTEHARILEAYVRLNLRCFGEDYVHGKAKIIRLPGDDDCYVIAPDYQPRYGRFGEAGMYDADERARLHGHTPGAIIGDADFDADRLLLDRHLPKAYALHLDIISEKEVSDSAIWDVLRGLDSAGPRVDIIANYLRYNLARRLIGKAALSPSSYGETTVAEAQLIEAKVLLEMVRSEHGALRTAALHKMADVEIARIRLRHDGKPAVRHLEEGLRLLRLCKEEGDPTAVGSIAAVVRQLRTYEYMLSYAELSGMPETRTALACYVNLPGHASKARAYPGQARAEAEWIEKLESLGIRNDAAFIRLAANFHDAGENESCVRVLALCPPGDGIVQLMRAHLAIEKNDRTTALEHLKMAELDLRDKARRHHATISAHFEYGLSNETAMMYGRVHVEEASLLMLNGDFLGAARKLRLSGMDLFNQEYVQGCLLTTKELRQLADEETPNIRYTWRSGWNDEHDKGPLSKRDAPGVSFEDEVDRRIYSSARVTLARRLLQEGHIKESVPYWDIASQPHALRYATLMTVAVDATKPAKERGLAYWQAALTLRETPNLWACTSGHELVSGEFTPRYAMANRASTKDLRNVSAEEHARIEAAKAWTGPRNSFFRYGVAEHCLKASELLQGEQSAYVLWYGALALAYVDRAAAEPMRQKLLKDYGTTKIGRQAMAAKGLPRHVDEPEMK